MPFVAALFVDSAENQHGWSPSTGRRRGGRLIRLRGQPADFSPIKASRHTLSSFARVLRIANEPIRSSRGANPNGKSVFPHIDPVDPHKMGTPHEWETAMGTSHAEKIVKKMRAAKGRV